MVSDYNNVNEVSALRLAQTVEVHSPGGYGVNFKAQATWETFRDHLRVVFCSSRSEQDRILNAKFSRTNLVLLYWSAIIIFPYPLAYIIRLRLNPQWINCSGCEVQPVDAGIVIGEDVIALLLATAANTFRVRKKDALRLSREWLWFWWLSGAWLLIAYVLYLTDPSQIYALGIFNWRFLLNFACLFSLYIQTVHQKSCDCSKASKRFTANANVQSR